MRSNVLVYERFDLFYLHFKRYYTAELFKNDSENLARIMNLAQRRVRRSELHLPITVFNLEENKHHQPQKNENRSVKQSLP